ncbi:MAG: cobyric acid synthase [Alphaproteobacteria bacterium]
MTGSWHGRAAQGGAKALMIQGTGSDVGKSLIVAGLCRLARRRGLHVAPFKPQNMSNNAAACADGGEIGRAQALQARAAGLAPSVHFNPVLLKPQSDRTSQVVIQGRPVSTLKAADFRTRKALFLDAVLDSFGRLARAHDLILVEGAGSPAEVNLRAGDIANMGFARAAGVPVCLIGDIDRGGVIAALVGTRSVLEPADAAHIVGFAVNQFRGDPALFEDGAAFITARTGWPCFGIVPWLGAAARLPAEDAVVLETPAVRVARDKSEQRLRIAAPMLSRIANFDDADPLRLEPSVDFAFVPPGRPIPRDADVVVLFGTKSTLGDLAFLRAQGWDHDIIAHARAGGRVLGLCGGFQMLGTRIIDEAGHDGEAGSAQGLGLLPCDTVMTGDKTVRPVTGTCAVAGVPVQGYEIHTGRTAGPALADPMLNLSHGPDGARAAGGRIEGTYVHGLFAADGFRRAWLARAGAPSGAALDYETSLETALDAVADGLHQALDSDALFASARPVGWTP